MQDGNLASCAEDDSVIIWASKKLEVKHTLMGHTKAIWDVAAIPGKRFVSASEDRTLKMWDAVKGECLATLTGHKE